MKTRTEELCPSLNEIKVCKRAIDKLEKEWYNNSTQEDFFNARKQMRIYKQVMKIHAERLVAQLEDVLKRDKEYYLAYASSPNEIMMRDYLLNEESDDEKD